MMTINILAVGNLKEQYLRDAIAEYLKRISRFAKVNVIEVPEGRDEGKHLLEKAAGFTVALDMNGKHLTSEEFSEFIADKAVEGVSKITFIIGGSDGLCPEILKKADARLSFSKLTFPHQLMRVIFAEQLYRAFMIAGGNPYHK